MLMKFDIIFGHYINYVQGVNSVTNMFLHGKGIFGERGLELKCIYHPLGSFDCIHNSDLYKSENGNGDNRYTYHTPTWKKRITEIAMKTAVGQALHFYVRNVLPAKRTIKQIPQNAEFDAVLFQDALSAYYFYKRGLVCKRSVWLSHSNENVFQALETNLPQMNKSRIFSSWYKNFYYKTCKCVDKVVFLSPSVANAIDFIPDNKKAWVFNGIDDTVFCPKQHDKINIVVLGSVIWRKGQIFLLKSLAHMPEMVRKSLHVFVAGTGSELDMCQDYVKDNQLSDLVTFCGQVTKVDELLQEMDIMVLPSLNEGMPISILEGMRQGVYTLVTRVGGCVDMLNNEVGEFIERDAQSIANAITHVIEDKLINYERKVAIRRHFDENFSLNKFVNSYADILLEA